MVAAEAAVEEAGNESYTQEHMSAIFQEGFSFSGYERDFLALSRGGEHFLDVSGVSGIDSIGDGRGAAFADFDNDGDLDVFVVSLQRTAHELFRNNVGAEQGFIRVEPVGRAGTDAFGTVVRVKTPSGLQTKVKSGGSGFLAQHDPRLLFGLGRAPRAEWIEVTWPDGATQRIEAMHGRPGVPSGVALRVERDGAATLVEERRFALADPLDSASRLLTTLEIAPGDTFPDLTLRSDEEIPGLRGPGGDAASVHDLLRPGRRLLLNIWATWCVPCRREIPELERLAPELAGNGIDLVGLSIDTEGLDRIVPFLDQVGATYPVRVTADPRIADLYAGGEVSIPLSVMLDEEGRILQIIGGWSAATEAQFEALAR